MAKYIEKSDLENKELDVLPIRRGCGASQCACLGVCMSIVGYVERSEYDKFVSQSESLEQFLTDKALGNFRRKPTYEELVDALKDTHNLFVEAVKSNYQTHHITRVMGNDHILNRLC